MSTNLLPTNASSAIPFTRPGSRPAQSAVLLAVEGRAQAEESRTVRIGQHAAAPTHGTPRLVHPVIDVSPSHLVGRRPLTRHGVTAEIVQAKTLGRIEFRFRAPMHLLVLCERGMRRDGETFVEGLPRSTLRDLSHKLTFVPAGHEYCEWHDPRILTRLAYFYFDPDGLPETEEPASTETQLAPRLFFEDRALSCTAGKMQALIEAPEADNKLYFDALGVVLAHELMRFNGGTPCVNSPVRGGLAAWQQRIAVDYIEENLAEQIPLAALAALVRLSPHYFCRAFKQSFRVPPHQYHSSRRIEHAKVLLARPSSSVTEIGLAMGFSTTSSFTAAFRKAVGRTPTEYRRSLD
jgi:AraC family transcriptional regulator